MADALPLARPELALPSLLTAAEVCQVARYSRAKLRTEVAADRMPKPVSRGRQHVFNRDAVLTALGIMQDAAQPEVDPWIAGADAYQEPDRRQKVKA